MVLWGAVSRRLVVAKLRIAFGPAYRWLTRQRVVPAVLPRQLRPRVLSFHAHGHPHHQLWLGKRLIGRYDPVGDVWTIDPPFRLFVDLTQLPGYGGDHNLDARSTLHYIHTCGARSSATEAGFQKADDGALKSRGWRA
jgi:hypothetical protein